jgi:transcriptional regulator with XRE-family HTH domain
MPSPKKTNPTSRSALIEDRERRGVSRSRLAQKMGGVSRHYIYQVEMGQRHPSFDFMKRWVKALGPDASLALFGNWRLKPVEKVEWLAENDAA